MRALLRRWAGWALAAAAVGLPAAAPAQAPAVTEQEVKSAYLFKFLPYVEWPPGTFAAPDAPIVVGVLGSDAIAAELQGLVEGRRVQGHPVQVRSLHPGEPLGGLQAVFVGRAEEERLPGIARALHGRPVLIVSESQDGLDRGSTVNFLVSGGRVRFEVSLEGAARSGLRISSRMLSVAMSVRPAHP